MKSNRGFSSSVVLFAVLGLTVTLFLVRKLYINKVYTLPVGQNEEVAPMNKTNSIQVPQKDGLSHGPTFPITSCVNIEKPGIYTLSQNVLKKESGICLKISNVKAVTINCEAHQVVGETPLMIENSSDVTLRACYFDGHTSESSEVVITNSQDITIENSFFNERKSPRRFTIFVSDSFNISLRENTVFGRYAQTFSKNTLLEKNTFILANPSKWSLGGGLIELAYGSFNRVVANTIDGAMITGTQLGADDGILINSESNGYIAYNQIKNTWDCGIETFATIKETSFEKNTIHNTAYCGIGGWHYNSLLNNSFKNNTIKDTKFGFMFGRVHGMRPVQTQGNSGNIIPADTAYFKNNVFSGNILSGTTSASSFTLLPGDDVSQVSGERPVSVTDIQISGNIFSSNDFDSVFAPTFSPAEIATDGGSNKCEPVESMANYPKGYPLKCK